MRNSFKALLISTLLFTNLAFLFPGPRNPQDTSAMHTLATTILARGSSRLVAAKGAYASPLPLRELSAMKRTRTSPGPAKSRQKSPETTPTLVRSKSAPAGSPKEAIPCDLVTPQPLGAGGKYCKIMTWNVNGLRAITKKNAAVLANLVETHQPDVLCLQETKLQQGDVAAFEALLPGYSDYWLCSTAKLGYAGTAVFVKTAAGQPTVHPQRKGSLADFWGATPNAVEEAAVATVQAAEEGTVKVATDSAPSLRVVGVTYDLADNRFNNEGRTITVEFEQFYLVACYVPNSGQTLQRLDYRVQEWDVHFREYLASLRSKKPVILTGDLNVAHLDHDIYNVEAKHVKKTAGCTDVERNSFGTLLKSGFLDAFRFYYPTAKGQYTYWNVRTGARSTNRGLRLDYFICSENMFPPVATVPFLPGSAEMPGVLGYGDSNPRTPTPRKRGRKSAGASSEERKSEVDPDEDASTEEEEAGGEDAGASRVAQRTQLQGPLPSPGVFDCYHLQHDTVGYSDHCPAVLVLSL